jgi:hypothetical protein
VFSAALELLVGLAIVLLVILSAVRTFVVPRGTPDQLVRVLFVIMRYVFLAPFERSPRGRREQSLAYFAPVTLLCLPIIWLGGILLGYAAIYRAVGARSWVEAIDTSRLSLLYLGANVNTLPEGTFIAFSETVFSLVLAAILVSYLPTIYSAFSAREQAVTGLETLAGSPPSPVKLLVRYQLIQGIDRIGEIWARWQEWFQVTEETHTALMPLVFYRSPQPERSWVTAAGAVLDTAALVASTLDRPRDPEAELCIRAGYLCLRRVAGMFSIPFHTEPAPTDPISVRQEEFDAVYDQLAAAGVPLKPDREECWRHFRGWRVNYDAALVGLAVLTLAPPGYWSTDRKRPSTMFVRSGYLAAQRAAAAALEGQVTE